jgi:hypothetical protein
MSRNTLSRDEWTVMGEIIRLGGSATRAQLIERSVEKSWHIAVGKALQSMERKGKVTKTWIPGQDYPLWSRVPRGERHPARFGIINKP